MAEIFGELDIRLSVVPRWVVIPTIRKQSVAEHCFNVERIARRIAIQWFEIPPEKIDMVSQMALHHDDDEAITGDIASPAKVILSEKYLDYVSGLWYNNADPPLRRIVKLADLMEMHVFLRMEIKLGNQYVREFSYDVYNRMVDLAQEFGKPIQDHINIWAGAVSDMEGRIYAPGSSKSGAASSGR